MNPKNPGNPGHPLGKSWKTLDTRLCRNGSNGCPVFRGPGFGSDLDPDLAGEILDTHLRRNRSNGCPVFRGPGSGADLNPDLARSICKAILDTHLKCWEGAILDTHLCRTRSNGYPVLWVSSFPEAMGVQFSGVRGSALIWIPIWPGKSWTPTCAATEAMGVQFSGKPWTPTCAATEAMGVQFYAVCWGNGYPVLCPGCNGCPVLLWVSSFPPVFRGPALIWIPIWPGMGILDTHLRRTGSNGCPVLCPHRKQWVSSFLSFPGSGADLDPDLARSIAHIGWGMYNWVSPFGCAF